MGTKNLPPIIYNFSMKYIRYLSNWTTSILTGSVCSSLVGNTWIMYWRAVLLSVNCFSPVGLGNYSEPGSNTFKQFISCQWPPEIVSTVDPLLNLPASGQACVLHPLIAHWTLWENPFLKSARKVIKDLLRVASVQLFKVPQLLWCNVPQTWIWANCVFLQCPPSPLKYCKCCCILCFFDGVQRHLEWPETW